MSVLLYAVVLVSTSSLLPVSGISAVEYVSASDNSPQYHPDAAKWFRRIYLKPGAVTPTWWLDRYLRDSDETYPSDDDAPPRNNDGIEVERRPKFIGKRKQGVYDSDVVAMSDISPRFNGPESLSEHNTDVRSAIERLQSLLGNSAILQEEQWPAVDNDDVGLSAYATPLEELSDEPTQLKRSRSYLGKRSTSYIDKRQRVYIGKRVQRSPTEHRSPSYIGKRGRSYLGKRGRSYLGKRGRSYLGKRMQSNLKDMIKRARSYMGKRMRLSKKAAAYIGKREALHPSLDTYDMSQLDSNRHDGTGTNQQWNSYSDKRSRLYVGKRFVQLSDALNGKSAIAYPGQRTRTVNTKHVTTAYED